MVSEQEYRFARFVLMAYGSCLTGDCTDKTIMAEAAKIIFAAQRTVKEYEDGQ